MHPGFTSPPVMSINPVTAARRAALHTPVTAALQAGHTHLAGVDEAVRTDTTSKTKFSNSYTYPPPSDHHPQRHV